MPVERINDEHIFYLQRMLHFFFHLLFTTTKDKEWKDEEKKNTSIASDTAKTDVGEMHKIDIAHTRI